MKTFANYELLEKIGSGGFGKVYKARHRQSRRVAAVKIATKPDYIAYLRANGVIQHNLEHPNIVEVLEMDVEAEIPYIVMEFCEGSSLEDKLKERYRFSENEIKDIITQAANGIGYAHDCDVIHGDIKPANILFQKGRVKVTDFGLCGLVGKEGYELQRSLDEKNKVIGTGKYVAPELYETGKPTVQSDIFAFGKVIFDMLRKSDYSHVKEIAIKATQEFPEERYSSVNRMLLDLKKGSAYLQKPKEKKKNPLLILAAAGLLIATSIPGYYFMSRPQENPTQQAISQRQKPNSYTEIISRENVQTVKEKPSYSAPSPETQTSHVPLPKRRIVLDGSPGPGRVISAKPKRITQKLRTKKRTIKTTIAKPKPATKSTTTKQPTPMLKPKPSIPLDYNSRINEIRHIYYRGNREKAEEKYKMLKIELEAEEFPATEERLQRIGGVLGLE